VRSRSPAKLHCGRAYPHGVDEFWRAGPGWVLWRTDDGGLLPYNTQSRMARIIEDEDEASRVQQLMIRDGVPVVDDLPPE
jgi:hypothetical protein